MYICMYVCYTLVTILFIEFFHLVHLNVKTSFIIIVNVIIYFAHKCMYYSFIYYISDIRTL